MDRENQRLTPTMMSKFKVKIIYPMTLLFLSISLTSCAEKFQAADLYGTYIATYPMGIAKIILKQDGVYYQEVKMASDPKTYTQTEKWKYDNRNAETEVVLEKAFVVVDGFGKLKKDYNVPGEGISVLPVERVFFNRKIRLGSDEGIPYIKIN